MLGIWRRKQGAGRDFWPIDPGVLEGLHDYPGAMLSAPFQDKTLAGCGPIITAYSQIRLLAVLALGNLWW
jgi:hypothetical protein